MIVKSVMYSHKVTTNLYIFFDYISNQPTVSKLAPLYVKLATDRNLLLLK